MIGLPEIREAARLLEGVARRTPLEHSEALSRLVGARVLVKGEHRQRTGSFKIRGAYVRISALDDRQRAAGVIAASAGNHGQGVAWAASRLGVRATIVMPVYASLPKVEATRGYGAEVVLDGETFDESLARAGALSAERGALLVHPFDDPLVIAGQGTVGLEIAEQAADARRVVVPVGGGGLSAGIASALSELAPGVSVVGVRPASTPATIADGAAVGRVGRLPGEIIGRLVDEMAEIEDEAVSEAIVVYLERTKQLVEGAGALSLAALLSGAVRPADDTVLVASGGNIDPGLLMRVIRHGLTTAGRYLFLRLQLRDRPGELQHVLALLAGLFVNVVSVVHHRAGLTLPLEQVEVELTLETRDRKHAAEVVRALKDAGYRPLES